MSLPWIEKYRPSKLSKIISHENMGEILKKCIISGDIPNMIMYGPPGIGKTSIIRAFANDFYGDNVMNMTIEINASEERGIDVVRNKIVSFANISNFIETTRKIRMIILDEADSMTVDAQIALTNVMDTYSSSCRYCLVCNYIKKIHYSIISRCIKMRFKPLTGNIIFDHVRYICEEEKINITDKGITTIIELSHGDMRKILNVLQSIKMTNNKIDEKDVVKYLDKISDEKIYEIIDVLCNKSINECIEKIMNDICIKGLSFYELLNSINKIILKYVCTDDTECTTLKEIGTENIVDVLEFFGDVEKKCLMGLSNIILVSSFVGSWKLART